MPDIDKKALFDALKERLETELARAQKRAKDAADGATHEENRAEGDKDMRATEASYMARGQAGRASEMEESLVRVSALELLSFKPGARIAISALIELLHDGKHLHYFLVPAAGAGNSLHQPGLPCAERADEGNRRPRRQGRRKGGAESFGVGLRL